MSDQNTCIISTCARAELALLGLLATCSFSQMIKAKACAKWMRNTAMMELQRMVMKILIPIAPLARGIQHAKLVTPTGGMGMGERRAWREWMGQADGRSLKS